MKKIICIVLSVMLGVLSLTGCIQTISKESIEAKESKSLIESNNEFAFDIFKQLNAEDSEKNVFISPLSISSALTMTLNGANGSTREAMEKALSYQGITREELNKGYKHLLNRLQKLDKKVDINIANSIWIRDGFSVKPEFIDTNKEAFNAMVENLDFSSPKAADTINKWIEDATKKLIPKMIDPPISSNVVMYLINAIYFKGQWTHQFDPKRTYEADFHSLSGQNSKKSIMSRKGTVDYYNSGEYKVVRLPYGEGKVSMYCILPEEGRDINNFADELTLSKWEEMRDSVKPVDDVILGIPKFKMEYGIKELKEALSQMGMGEAFGFNADFSGIADGIAISRVLHKAVIDVNEEGTEAAGVTVVEMKETAMVEPITFIANRPFFFMIADDEDGSILFMGKMVE